MKKTRSFVLSLALVLIAFSLYAQEMPKEAAKAYNEGNQFLKAGNYENAIKKYHEALQFSKDYRIFYQLGVAYKKQNKLSEAEEAFKNSIKSNSEFNLAYNGLGGTYFLEGKYQEAVEAFKKFAELTNKKSLKDQANENIARAYVKLAETSKKDGNYQKAIEQLREAIKFNEFDAAYVLLANTLYENGDYDEAIKAADKVISMNSKLKGAAYYYKGLALKQKQDTEKAKEYFELAKKDPQYKKLAEYELKFLR
ncbi:tetratricopeptide repeat protein [Melioribacter sp. OK-6-Me]|uniref:tetratricopeptide repeat protein n=1 Tax=unclassified Melioribacter TaxID=2627329 RepID=UPI003ED8D965